MKKRIFRALAVASFALPAIVPFECVKPLVNTLTPYLIDGSNGFIHDLVFAVAPAVLP